MGYDAQFALTNDSDFYGRSYACAVQQADVFINDQRPDYVAVAHAVLRDDPGFGSAFVRLAAAGPGIADKADNGDGTIDSSKVTDADLLSLTQANWPVVAGLYFNTDGTPIP
ncbi:MAG TPA: hypothetical protein VGH66_13960 [Acidimicrobiales bacterium]|jgi:hypothetical protein